MNKAEAELLLITLLNEYRQKPYAALTAYIEYEPATQEVRGASGADYQVEVHCVWDGHRDGAVRVTGSIDDGGLRAFLPVTRSFIKARDGSFVDE